MISTKIIKTKGFWKTVFLYWAIFVFVANVVRILASYGLDFSAFVSKELSQGKIFMFVVSNVLLWFVLGFVLAYFNFKRNRIKNEK